MTKLIGGDFNIPSVTWSPLHGPPHLDKFFGILESNAWTQVVRKAARKSNLLDLIFLQNAPNYSVSTSLEFPGRDHKVVLCQLIVNECSCTKSKTNDPLDSRRNYAQINWSNTEKLLHDLNWDIFFSSYEVNNSLDAFYHNINLCLDSVAPFKVIKRHIPNSEYIPVKFKNKLRKLRKRLFVQHDFSVISSIHSVFTNIANYRKTRELEAEKMLLKLPDKIAYLAATLRKKLYAQSSLPTTLKIKNKITSNPMEICEAFSESFAHSFTKISPLIGMISNFNQHKLTGMKFTVTNVRNAIRSLKPSFNSGEDGIPVNLIKCGSSAFPILLTKIFNLSLEDGIFPSSWKTTYIIPHFKKGTRLSIENYRPINHSSVLSRVMEKVIKEEIYTHIVKHKLIKSSQHGFVSKKSCITCHLEYFDYIINNRDDGKLIVTLYFDFTKAFDKVHHSSLLYKLQAFGITGKLHDWLASFLKDRIQLVKLGRYLSRPQNITSGVFQGSVIGPLLFIMYVNDICHCFQEGKTFMFADDLKVVYTFNPDEGRNINDIIQRDLNKLSKWCDKWFLPLNTQKSGYLCFGESNPEINLHLNEHEFRHLNGVCDLGVRYSKSLSFTEHASSQVSKARRLIGFIHRNYRLSESKVILYKTCVRPLLEYCPIIYSCMRSLDRQKIEKVQRHLTRLLTPGRPYDARCCAWKLDPLWVRRIKLNLTILYKILHKDIITDCTALTFAGKHKYDLRNQNSLVTVQRATSKLKSSFFVVRYANLWNRLPESIRQSNSLSQFRLAINLHLDNAGICNLLNTTYIDYGTFINGPPGI
ncbi:hypothetical protein MN116_000553 [Schistosoma mekongi]|uniref:Reverse transcriptase domain-containing protein n=1 Tax=Schistosoma mekongi TaxID=38744 RepID=A0AAE1ZCJ9_SCHME|nr:hypothetical protein MN116_000553 [Schistosoma mekongi]